MVTVCFRFDDPSAISDQRLETQIFECFAKRGMRLTVAAIPFVRGTDDKRIALSRENAAHLIDASARGVIEIAQHGHSHAALGSTTTGAQSEFTGLDPVRQAAMISEGRELLSDAFGRPVEGFVPPWNSYDASTERALQQQGFLYLSAGIGPAGERGIVNIPRTCNLRTARPAIEEARRFGALAPVVVVVMHPDEFEEYPYPPGPGEAPPFTSLRHLDELLGWSASAADLRVRTLGDLAAEARSGRPLWHFDRFAWVRRLPFRVRSRLPRYFLGGVGIWRGLAAMAGVVWSSRSARTPPA